MAAAINAHLEANPDHIDISCDSRNAFNTWQSALGPLPAHFPSIFAICKLIYGSASDVIFFECAFGLKSILSAAVLRQG